ncbi:hypothetical protein LTS18_009287, partial [Coniosporium uncinatum]
PRLTISINAANEPLDGEILTFDLPDDLAIADLKAFIEGETNFLTSHQVIFFNGQTVQDDSKTLEQVGVKDGDMMVMMVNRGPPRQQQRQPQRQRNNQNGGVRMPTRAEVENTRIRFLRDDNALEDLRGRQASLAEAVYDTDAFWNAWLEAVREENERERERARQIERLNADPFDLEAQQKIEEMIRQDNVMTNLQDAIENNPEVFARVTMLYINAEVNGHPVKAFVDSGAQATIMSPSCAEACGIMRLIDRRYAGIAKGVGTAVILGRVHSAEMKIGDAEMPCAFTVMEGKDVDLLFGLDMLKRYQANIDLKRNVLVLGNTEVPFLPESEIPKYFEDAQAQEPTVPGPNGTEIGAKSGAVQPAGTAAAAAAGVASRDTSSQASNFSGQGRTLGGPSSQSGAQSNSQTSVAPGAAPGSAHPQDSIEKLEALGFSRSQAIAALDATGGNVEYAAGMLFQG